MKNKDQQCFKWGVTRALNPVECHLERVKDLRKLSEKYNWNGIEFPTPCSETDFKKVEKNNNVSILVFGHTVIYDPITKIPRTYIIPLYVPTERHETVVRLFSLKNGDQTHYCVIKDLSRLVGSQLSKNKYKNTSVITA